MDLQALMTATVGKWQRNDRQLASVPN